MVILDAHLQPNYIKLTPRLPGTAVDLISAVLFYVSGLLHSRLSAPLLCSRDYFLAPFSLSRGVLPGPICGPPQFMDLFCGPLSLGWTFSMVRITPYIWGCVSCSW